MELQSLVWGVRLAARLGYTTVTLVSDSEVAIAQLLKVRAKSVLSVQQSILRGLARRMVCSGLVVRILLVPSGFQPVDPMSRLQGNFGAIGLRPSKWPGSFINSCWIGIRWFSIVGCCAWVGARIHSQGRRWLPRRRWLLSLCACWGGDCSVP